VLISSVLCVEELSSTTWTFDRNGKMSNDFFEIRNGRKLRDVTTGTVAIAGPTISITRATTNIYVVRGWLELSNMTIMEVAGPWPTTQDIPARVFTDFSEATGRFIATDKWIRTK